MGGDLQIVFCGVLWGGVKCFLWGRYGCLQIRAFAKCFFVGAVLKVFLEGVFAKRPYIIHSKSD